MIFKYIINFGIFGKIKNIRYHSILERERVLKTYRVNIRALKIQKWEDVKLKINLERPHLE